MQKVKTILVVGANSFIGSRLIQLLKETASTTGVYHNNTNRLPQDISLLQVDQIDQLNDDFDEVYILSAFIPGKTALPTDKQQLFEANVFLVDRICSKFSKSRVVLASSVSVYKPRQGAITENDNEGGLTEYGISKRRGEQIVQQLPSHAIVRFSSVYGPGMKPDTILPAYIQQALQQRIITVWGEGSRLQNYIHISDAVQFLIKAAACSSNGVFLATGGHSTSNRQLASIIAGKTSAAVSFTGQDAAASFVYDNTHTTQVLQYSASMPLEKGIEETILWLQEKYSSLA